MRGTTAICIHGAQKKQSGHECPFLGEFYWHVAPSWRGQLDSMQSSIQEVTADSTETTVLPPTEICLGKVPASIKEGGTGHPDKA